MLSASLKALAGQQEAAKVYKTLRPIRVTAIIWPVLCVLSKVEDQLSWGQSPRQLCLGTRLGKPWEQLAINLRLLC